MSDDVFGNASYGGGYVKKEYRKLKDGESVYRIIPPLGYLRAKGIWSVFYNIHFGYKNSEGKMRIFDSPLVMNRKNKMVEVPDAALERIQKLKATFEEAKKSGNKELIQKLDALVGQKGQFNLDKNHHMLAVDAQGNIVILKLRHKAKQALDIEIDALRDQGIDPLSANDGRFFVFRRTGMGLDTTFKVSVLKEKLTVEGVGVVERDVVHKITKDIADRIVTTSDGGKTYNYKEGAELDKLYKRPTSAEVERIVKEGPKAVDDIFDAKGQTASSTSELNDNRYDSDEEVSALHGTQAPQSTTTVASVTTPTPQVISAAPQTVVTTQVVSAPSPTAIAPVTPALVAPSTVEQVFAPPSMPTNAGKNITEMSNDEFLASIGMN